jgi:hypothetical protein
MNSDFSKKLFHPFNPKFAFRIPHSAFRNPKSQYPSYDSKYDTGDMPRLKPEISVVQGFSPAAPHQALAENPTALYWQLCGKIIICRENFRSLILPLSLTLNVEP